MFVNESEQNDYYIELFSVGSRSEFYLNIASYRVFYAILFYFVDYGIPLSQIKIVLFIDMSIWIRIMCLSGETCLSESE
jgi:hypothetical protein